MQYLLDASLMEFPYGPAGFSVWHRISQHSPTDFGLSAIGLHALYSRALQSPERNRDLLFVDNLKFEVVSFELKDAREAGEIRAALAAQGNTRIDPYYVLIAGQAKARNLILITTGFGESQRIAGVQVENWGRPQGGFLV